MKELSLHILDIAMNSVRGEASVIAINIEVDDLKNYFEFSIMDNGKGIEADMLKTLKDPFTTSRTMRKVGLGIPLLNDTCINCMGSLQIESVVGQGTSVVASMELKHIDRPPLGDIGATIAGIMSSYDQIEVVFNYENGDHEFTISTSEIQEALDSVPIYNPEVVQWITTTINGHVGII